MDEKNVLEQMYWCQGLSLSQISKELGWSYSKVYKRFRVEYAIETHRSLWSKLELEDADLRRCLNNKYSMMARRVSGEHDPYGTYKEKYLLAEGEFVKLCNERKQRILWLWHQYLASGKQLKAAISIDRIDNNFGYSKDNLQFVTFGFNSWKDVINPIAIQRQGEQIRYFSSSEEAGRLYNCRPGDFREVLQNGKYNRQNVTISKINIDELLEHHNCTDLQEYYNRCLI